MSNLLIQPTDTGNPLAEPIRIQSNLDKKISLKKTRWRWLALLFLQFGIAGSYYIFDNPQTLQSHLQSDLNISTTEYTEFYNIYNFPNIVIPLIGGRIIDIFGVQLAVVLFAGLILAGQLLITFGGYVYSYWAILIGRLIFAIGGDSFQVAQSFFICEWFIGKELAFAYSFQNVVNGMASFGNSYLSPRLYDIGGLGLPLAFGAFVCLISLLSILGVVIMDKINDKREGRTGPKVFIGENEGINLKDMFKLPMLYWLIILIYGLICSAEYNFTDYANDELQERFGYDNETAGTVVGVSFSGVGGLLPPIWGLAVDFFGKRVFLMGLIIMMPLVANVIFFTGKDCSKTCYFPIPILPIVLLGIACGGNESVIFPSFATFLPERKLATAYAGTMVSQNIFLTIQGYISAEIIDAAPNSSIGYSRVSLMSIASCVLAIIACIILYGKDRQGGSKLQNVFLEAEVETQTDETLEDNKKKLNILDKLVEDECKVDNNVMFSKNLN